MTTIQTPLPDVTFPVAWDDNEAYWGPQPSDPLYGETEMVISSISLQRVRAFCAPQHPISINRSETPGYPDPDHYITGVQAPLAPTKQLYAPYQDTQASGQVAPDLAVALSAPDIPVGGTMLTRGDVIGNV